MRKKRYKRAEAIIQRAEEVGRFIVDTNSTIRGTAKRFGISKSSVAKDINTRLPEINNNLYMEVRNVIEKNKAERYSRGGQALKNKFKLGQ